MTKYDSTVFWWWTIILLITRCEGAFSGSFANATAICQTVNTIPREEQCQYAIDHCLGEEIGNINYLTLYYCFESSTKSNTLLLLSAVALVILFVSLGLAASDFLCPNLNSISKFFHTSENVTGLTLLAFGNGSPDIFSTYNSMKIGSGPLAIGELIGAALFISSVVVGSMSVIHPFRVVKKTFIRDILYFLVCLLVFDYFVLIRGNISWIGCVTLIALYVSYVIMVLVWQFINSRVKARKLKDLKARSQYFDDVEYDPISNPLNDDDDSGQQRYNENNMSNEGDDEEDENQPDINNLINNAAEGSVHLGYNPFLDEGLDDIDNRSHKSGGTNTSRIINNGVSGFLTYQDVISPGEVFGDDNLQYDIHTENDNENFEEDEFDDTMDTNKFFVRPSLMDAIKLNQNAQKSKPTTPEWLDESSAIDNQSSSNERISLHTVAQGIHDASMARPYSEPIRPPEDITVDNRLSVSEPAYEDYPQLFDGSSETEELYLNTPVETEYESTSNHHYSQERESQSNLSQERNNKTKRAMGLTNLKSNYDLEKYLASSRLTIIFFPLLSDFSSKSLVDKILTSSVLPIFFFLRCTVPVIDYSNFRDTSKQLAELRNLKLVNEFTRETNDEALDYGSKVLEILYCKKTFAEYSDEKIILTLQTFTSIIILPWLVFASHKFYFPVVLPVSIVFALVLAKIILRSFSPENFGNGTISNRLLLVLRIKKVMYFTLSVLGFGMSMAWISEIAAEVVTILRLYSVVFNLSEAILGFTVFAVGNSLGDLIANFTIAKMGFPRMALAACFGGPLLNILTGVGVSGLIIMATNSSMNVGYDLEPNLTLWISNITLIANLLFLVIAVPRNGWKMDKWVGLLTICFWIIATIINILIEIF